jgi:hypothetical protein
MFQLTSVELENWKSQIVTSNADKMGLRKRPFAFTEQGVAMLSGVINSDIAISVSIQIIRVFVKLKKLLHQDMEILQKIKSAE